MNRLPPGLHIVATPIGNLGDLSPRAADTLRRADRILAEDTRVTAKLLGAYRRQGADEPLRRSQQRSGARTRSSRGSATEAIALVSDAGTPLISDPGYKLVRAARAAGHAGAHVPGPSAAIAALTLAGLPTDRFLFAGLPARQGQSARRCDRRARRRSARRWCSTRAGRGSATRLLRLREQLGTARRRGRARDHQAPRGMRDRHARRSWHSAMRTPRPRVRS